MENEKNETLVDQDVCSYYKGLGLKVALKPSGLQDIG